MRIILRNGDYVQALSKRGEIGLTVANFESQGTIEAQEKKEDSQSLDMAENFPLGAPESEALSTELGGSVGPPRRGPGATPGRPGSWPWSVSFGGSVVSPGGRLAGRRAGLDGWGREPGRLRAPWPPTSRGSVPCASPRLGFQTLLKLLLG